MYNQILKTLQPNRYMKRYIKLIKTYKIHEFQKYEVFEKHHILPKCLWKEYTDSDWNIIKLPPRAHYLAHFLLYKAKISSKLTFAFNMMNVISITQEGRRESNLLKHSKVYEQFKADMIIAIKKANTNMVTAFDKTILENVRITCDEFYKNRENYKHYNEGNVLIIDKDKKLVTVKQSEFNSEIHITPSKGMVTVYDKQGEKMRVQTNDPRYLSGEISTIKTNTIYVTDKLGDAMFIPTEMYHKNKDKYTHHSTGKVVVKTENGKNLTLTSEEFKNSDYTFHTKGRVTVKDKEGNMLSVSTDDERYKNGELEFHCTGKLNVKDLSGNSLFITSEEYNRNKDNYIFGTTGNAVVKDKEGNISRVSVSDPRYLSGELAGAQKGTITVKDKCGTNFRVSINDPKYLSGELIPVSKGLKWYYNQQTGKRTLCDEGEQMPDYIPGMGPKNKL